MDVKRFPIISIILLTFAFLTIPLQYLFYGDLLFSISTLVMFGGVGFLFGAMSEGTSMFGFGIPLAIENNDLLPKRYLPFAMVFGALFIWDDILSQSDELTKPWFWSAYVCSFTLFLVGTISLRYYRIRGKQREQKEQNEIQSNLENLP
ncbi:MAG: hypothetical protein ACFFED_05415 [Candidatus Thorarchaeota archaeon]